MLACVSAVWLFNIILIIIDSFGCEVALCGCFIMRIMLLSLGLFFMACLFVNARCSSLFFQLTLKDKFFSIEKNNVLLCVRYKKHDIKNNRRASVGKQQKYQRACFSQAGDFCCWGLCD